MAIKIQITKISDFISIVFTNIKAHISNFILINIIYKIRREKNKFWYKIDRIENSFQKEFLKSRREIAKTLDIYGTNWVILYTSLLQPRYPMEMNESRGEEQRQPAAYLLFF